MAVTHTPFMKTGRTCISFNGFVPLNPVFTPTYCFHLRILILWSRLQDWHTVRSHYLTAGRELTTDTLTILVFTCSPCNLGLQSLTVFLCNTGFCVFFFLNIYLFCMLNYYEVILHATVFSYTVSIRLHNINYYYLFYM
jgi:hypothetical protein